MGEEKQDIKPTKKKKSIVRKFLSIILYIILAIIGINILLYVLLSIPFVQQEAKDIAVKELKSMLNTEISIDRLDLRLFNNVALKGVYIEDQNKDTLLYANNVNASIDIWKLFKNDLQITGVGLNDFVINVNRKDSVSDFNFQFIIDTFSSDDTTQVDTTKSSMKIAIKNISIRNGKLNYNVLSAPKTPNLFNVDHISISEFNADIDLNSIDTDNLDIELGSLSAKEKTGLIIEELKAQLFSNKSELTLKSASLKTPNSHLILSTSTYNLDTNTFRVKTEDTEIDAKDFSSILPGLKYLKDQISLKTEIYGKLPSVNIENIAVNYGENLKIEGKANMSNVERYGVSEIGISIDKFKVTPEAIASFAKVGDSTFIMPDILKTIGDIHLQANLSGYLNDFKLKGELWTRQGAIDVNLKGSADTTFTKFKVNSHLYTNGINLSKIVGAESGLGKIAMETNITADQTTIDNLKAELKGRINSIQYQDQSIKNIDFGGFYNPKEMGANLLASLPIGKISALASMTQTKVPDIHINLSIDSLRTNYLFKNEDWVDPLLTLQLDGNINGLDINNMTGKLDVKDFDFQDSSFHVKPGPFNLEIKRNATNKIITFNSSFLYADLDGEYELTTLPDELMNITNIALPNLFDKKDIIKNKGKNNFKFSIVSKDVSEIMKMAGLPVSLDKPIDIKGNINTANNEIVIGANAPLVYYDNIGINNTKIAISNKDSIFDISLTSGVMMEEDLYDVSFKSDITNNKIHSFLNLKNEDPDLKIDGSIEALTYFVRNDKNKLVTFSQIIPSNIHIGDLDLYCMPARIINSDDKTEIHNVGIAVNKKRCFAVDGIISNNKDDSLKVFFDNAQVKDFLEPFNIKNISACINGNIVMTNILDKPIVYTNDFEIADIALFGDTLGTLSLSSKWNNSLGGMGLKSSLVHNKQTYASVTGYVYNKMETIEMKINVDKMPVKWLQPFVAETLNKLDGSLSSNIKISGKISKPDVEGWLGANNILVGIDLTNVVYKINDTIQVSKDKIGFDKLMIEDQYNNKGNVSAEVTYKNFNDIKYKLAANMTNLMVLNTPLRTDSLYYGTVFATGTANINGDNNGATINMNIRNGKKSKLNITIPQTSEAIQYKSIVYINVPEDKLNSESEKNVPAFESSLPIKLNIALDINPDIEIGVIIDPATGDAMKVKGTGHVDFSCDLQTMNMKTFGNYVISDGSAKFNLQQISNLEFKVKEGSELRFVGDPLKTRFNITAYRRVKADLKTLNSSFGDSDGSSKQTVDCLLEIDGNMDNIQLSYNIALPDASDEIQNRVSSLINTEEQKTLQFAYLILSGSFYSSGGDGANIGTGMVTSFATGKISNGLDAVFGKLLGNKFEVGTNIESNDGSFTNMDMSLNVSTKLFNDKLRLKTNLGYKMDQTSTNDNPFIGDFDIEYILTPNWTLKAYNHTNNDYYRQSNITQGVGISYTKEAKRIKQLFNFFGKKRRRQRQSQKESIVKQPIINDEKNK